MAAKKDLFERLQYLNNALSLPVLIDVGIAVSDHNGVANLLRKGMGIVAFNVMEDFIKNKSTGALRSISESLLPFGSLTESLQIASTWGALNALVFRSGMQKKEGGDDYIKMIQEEAYKIHSTKNGNYELSNLSLVNSSSNVLATEVGDIIKSFGISGGWTKLGEISKEIGGGVPDLAQAFRNSASRRHKAAHVANFQYNYLWISNLRNEILAISSSLDICLTAMCRQVNSNPNISINSHVIEDALNYRFLEKDGSHYRETVNIGGRSIKNWPSLEEAVMTLQPKLVVKREFLIILDAAKRIEDWVV